MELARNGWTGDTARRMAARALRLWAQQDLMIDISDAELNAIFTRIARTKPQTPWSMTEERKATMQRECKEIIVLASDFAIRWNGGRHDLFHGRMQKKPTITFSDALASLMSDVSVSYSDTKRARMAP